jgi:hypothetical protein
LSLTRPAGSRLNSLLFASNLDVPEQKPLFSPLHCFVPSNLLDLVSKMRSISPNNLALVTGLFFSFSYLSTINALKITVLQPGIPFVPEKILPLPYAASECDEIAELFQNQGRTMVWNLVDAVKFEGDTYEPEGMVRVGDDRYFVSAGEYTVPTVSYGNNTIINGTNRTAGTGFAHLIVFDANGTRIADATLTETGAIEYHNGGIDYDGEYIWATIEQYRPNSTATIVCIDPRTLSPAQILHTDDHEGGIVHDTLTDDIVILGWGSRNTSTWNLQQKFETPPSDTPALKVTRNPSYYVDHQDCKYRQNSTPLHCGRGAAREIMAGKRVAGELSTPAGRVPVQPPLNLRCSHAAFASPFSTTPDLSLAGTLRHNISSFRS